MSVIIIFKSFSTVQNPACSSWDTSLLVCLFPSYGWITSSRLVCVQVFCSLQCSLGHSLVFVWGTNVQENTKVDQHQSKQQEEETFHVSFIGIFTWIPNTVASRSHYDNKNTCHIVSKCDCQVKETHHQSFKTLGGLGIRKLKSCGGEWTRLVTPSGEEWCSQWQCSQLLLTNVAQVGFLSSQS